MLNDSLIERILYSKRYSLIKKEFESLSKEEQLVLQEEVKRLSEMSLAKLGLIYLDRTSDEKLNKGYEEFKRQFYSTEMEFGELSSWGIFKKIVEGYFINPASKDTKEYSGLPIDRKMAYWRMMKNWFNRLINEDIKS